MMAKYFLLLFFLISAAACVNHDLIEPVDCDQSDLTISLDSIHEATSCSVQDGYIRVTAVGGKAPYAFSKNGDTGQTSGIFSDLAAGTYTVSVTDNKGCEVTLNNISITAEDILFSAIIQKDSLCIDHSGMITISITGGNTPYTFKLDNGLFSETNSFSGLKHGAHTVIVKDNIGCSIQLNMVVPRDTTGTSWTTDILPIIKTSCALNGCHDGKTRFDYRLYQNAKKDRLTIKAKTQNKSMPFEGSIPQEQIDMIACWVDDGAPEN